jgi:methyl-accepting chemotaxis protein
MPSVQDFLREGRSPVGADVATGDRDALLALLGPSQAALKAQGLNLLNVTLPPATMFLRLHDPKAFGDDISDRRKTVVTANNTGQPIVGVEPGRDTLSIYAITPIMRDGKSLAVVDMGITLGQKFVDRAKQRFGVDLVVHRVQGDGFTTLASTFSGQGIATAEELKSAFGGATVRRAATLSGHPASLYLGQVKDYAGEPVAVIELLKDTTEYEAAAADAQLDLVIGTVVILGVAVVLALLLGRSLSRPLIEITATMNRLSGGDTGVTIPGSERPDELGQMANAVQVFKDSMIETERLRAEQELVKQRAAAERRQAMLGLAARFESEVGGIVTYVASAAVELQFSAQSMAATSEETTRQASTVAVAAEQATVSAQTVATATEELSASIREIGQQVARSSDMTREAVQQATRDRMRRYAN